MDQVELFAETGASNRRHRVDEERGPDRVRRLAGEVL
jgi:hypothetical protein